MYSIAMIYNRIATIAYGRLVPEVKWSQLKMQCNFYILKSTVVGWLVAANPFMEKPF